MLEQILGDMTDVAAGSAVGLVYESLRKKIVLLEYPPGTALSRNAVAQEYGVSLTPVREAMQRLEEDGLLNIMPQSGTVVKRIDVAQLNETQFLRVATETEVVRRLALQARDTAGDAGSGTVQDTLARAGAILTMQIALDGNIAQMNMFNELDRAFHRALFAGVGMTSLQAIVQRRLGHLLRCQKLDLPSEGKMAQIVADHRSILAAIENGDPQAAAAAMRSHLSGTIQRLDILRAAHPEYFSEG